MPVTSVYTPDEKRALNNKIQATRPGDEYLIVGDVMRHMRLRGFAIYQQTQDEITDVRLTAWNCCVFLIGGTFKIGQELFTGRGLGYILENETQIQLQTYSIVVIIDREQE